MRIERIMSAVEGEIVRDSARDLGVSVTLVERQGGACWDCGRVAPLEFTHWAGRSGRVVEIEGELYAVGAMGCRTCNDVHRAVSAALGTPGRLPVAYVTARMGETVEPMGTRAELVAAGREATASTRREIAERVEAALAAL